MIYYLDILKTNKAEHEGTIRCLAKNIKGEKDTTCQLKIIPKLDYWSVLKVTKEEEPETKPKEGEAEKKPAAQEQSKHLNKFLKS